ncbi:MAG TPA: response regulator [Anaerolineaceae bacterium]|jgi:CheY-like chemotaxis protein
MSRRVLAIDDDKIFQRMIQIILQKGRNEVVVMSSVEEGFAYLKANPVDVVTCDLNLPGLGGIDFLKMVQADPGTCQIPVVLITAAGFPSDYEMAFQAGAAGVLEKPFGSVELEEALQKAIDKKKAV